jgi:hypothetical protein
MPDGSGVVEYCGDAPDDQIRERSSSGETWRGSCLERAKEVCVSSRENPSSPAPAWTYRMEVSPTGQGPSASIANPNDPILLLHLLANLQNQTLELQRQTLEMQRQQLDISRELLQVNREQRARQGAELERWQAGHEPILETCRETLGKLEQVHASLMGELANYVDENYENLLEGDFSLSDFVDRFGPRLAHLNTMLAVLRPLAAAKSKTES